MRGNASPGRPPMYDERPRRQKKSFFRRGWVKWVFIAAAGWILLSFIAFAVSAQLQSMKLDGDARDALSGSPWLLTKAQNILIIGTDGRDPSSQEPGAAQEKRCYEQQARGQAPHDGGRIAPVTDPHLVDCAPQSADALACAEAAITGARRAEIATLRLAEQLISLPSVTPFDAGCIELIVARLQPLGFACEVIEMG